MAKTLQQLWIEAGGDPRQAETAAAIAMAESGGRVDAWNPNGLDKSAGLWQINYHGSLRKPRTRQFGTPEQLRRDPAANARAAVAIYNSAGSFSPWTTYTSGAYQKHLGTRRAVPSGTPAAQVSPRGGVPPQQARNIAAAGRTQGLKGRKQAARAMLDVAMSYAETGEISNDRMAKALGAVSRLGTVEPRTVKGELPRSKREGVAGGVVDKVLAAAHTQVGKPYEFGSGPSTATFDCSDLIQWSYKQVGVNIPRDTYGQMKVLPKKSWSDLKPGDAIYKNNGGHAVMYVGGGKVIAAPYTGTVVQYQPLDRFKNGDYHVRSVIN